MIQSLSLKIKLTIIFLLVFGSSLVGYTIFLYKTLSDSYQTDFDLALYNFAVEVGDSIDLSLLGYVNIDQKVFEEDRKIFPFSLDEALIQIRTMNGGILAKSRSLKSINFPFENPNRNVWDFQTYRIVDWDSPRQLNHEHYRLIDYLVARPTFSRFVLQIAVPNSRVNIYKKQLRNTFLSSVIGLILISSLLGYYFSHWALEPVRRIVKKAQTMGAHQLSERIPVPQSQDELRDLALTLNDLLDRLEIAFLSQERFVADASHQLKTPLAIIKGELELLERKGLKEISSVQEEVEHLIKLVSDLLILAKTDTQDQALELSPIQLDEVVTSAIDKLKKLAHSKSVSLRLNFSEELKESHDFLVLGDMHLLTSLFETLLDNSIKYSPPNSQIEIVIEKGLKVRILDQGPGIREEDQLRIFERFYRGKESKNQVIGSGLGLSIARAISHLHHADLQISNRPNGGLEVSFYIQSYNRPLS